MQQKQNFISLVFAVIVSVLAVTFIAQAASTISTNLATDGTLSVTGNSTLTGTLTVTGNSILTSADIGGAYSVGGSGATVSAAGALSLNGDVSVNGFATTTATTGMFATEGSIGSGTSSPATELSVSSSATTTLYLHSTSSTKGGCLQIEGPNGTVFRIYATTTGYALIESGSCK